MKHTELLLRPPRVSDLERMYFELASRGAPAVGKKSSWPYRNLSDEALFCLGADMMRYDARLLTILVQYISREFRALNPLRIREQMRRMRSPQALCVVAEFAKAAIPDPELHHYCDYLVAGVPKLEPAERLFLDVERVGGPLAAHKFGRNLREYVRWGFIGTERPTLDQGTRKLGGTYDVETRRRLLRETLQAVPGAGLAHLVHAVDSTVSRQQMLSDLKQIGARSTGHGRGAKWRLVR